MARENSRWGYRRIQGELVGRSGWFDRRPAMTVGPFLGDGHPSTLKVMSSLSTGLYDLGEYEQARILDEENLQWSRAAFSARIIPIR